MRYILPLILIAIFLADCKSPVRTSQSSWEKITIVSDEDEVITINNYDDTSTVKNYEAGSIFTGFHKVKIDSLKTYFTMAEKDSIYHLAQSIISSGVDPKGSCTDFVGDLKLNIDYGTLGEPWSRRQSIEYSGVCEWETLSLQTRQLQALLEKRIKLNKKLKSHSQN